MAGRREPGAGRRPPGTCVSGRGGGADGPSIAIRKSGTSTYADGGGNTLAHGVGGAGGSGGSGVNSGFSGAPGATANVSP